MWWGQAQINKTKHIFKINNILCCEDVWSFSSCLVYYCRPKKYKVWEQFYILQTFFFVHENKISEMEQIWLLAVFIPHITHWVLSYMAGNNWISAYGNLRILTLWEGVRYDRVLTGSHWQCDMSGYYSNSGLEEYKQIAYLGLKRNAKIFWLIRSS